MLHMAATVKNVRILSTLSCMSSSHDNGAPSYGKLEHDDDDELLTVLI